MLLNFGVDWKVGIIFVVTVKTKDSSQRRTLLLLGKQKEVTLVEQWSILFLSHMLKGRENSELVPGGDFMHAYIYKSFIVLY